MRGAGCLVRNFCENCSNTRLLFCWWCQSKVNDASCNQCVQLFDLDHFVGNRILSKTRGSAAALTVLLLHKVVSFWIFYSICCCYDSYQPMTPRFHEFSSVTTYLDSHNINWNNFVIWKGDSKNDSTNQKMP